MGAKAPQPRPTEGLLPSCPKCGLPWHSQDVAGPPCPNGVRYKRLEGTAEEWLEETCARCGFVHKRPTLDSISSARGPRLLSPAPPPRSRRLWF